MWCDREQLTLPVAFSTESVTVVHQTLRSKTRNLIESLACLFYVYVAKVVKVGCECFGTFVLSIQRGE
jgi:hypothetical protein